MYFVYVITSQHRTYTYIGITDNPDRRITQHNRGYNRTTKPYRPFRVVLIEEYACIGVVPQIVYFRLTIPGFHIPPVNRKPAFINLSPVLNN